MRMMCGRHCVLKVHRLSEMWRMQQNVGRIMYYERNVVRGVAMSGDMAWL